MNKNHLYINKNKIFIKIIKKMTEIALTIMIKTKNTPIDIKNIKKDLNQIIMVKIKINIIILKHMFSFIWR